MIGAVDLGGRVVVVVVEEDVVELVVVGSEVEVVVVGSVVEVVDDVGSDVEDVVTDVPAS